MTIKEKFVLTALDSFSCLADKCPNHCCHSWVVRLSPLIYSRWLDIPDSDPRKAWLLSNVVAGADGMQLAKTNSTQHTNCVFLQSDGLCRIHKELGAEYLPDICRTFPRVTEDLPDCEISTAGMSCPEIARLVLTNEAEPVFRREPAEDSDEAPPAEEKATIFFNQHLHGLFESNEPDLNLRLAYLARVVVDIASLAQSRQLNRENLDRITNNRDETLRQLSSAVNDGKFITNPINGYRMWNLLRSGTVRFKLFQECGVPPDMSIVRLAARAESDDQAKAQFYQELMAARTANRHRVMEYQPIFSRYLEARLISAGFSFAPDAEPVGQFLTAAFPFAVIQMILWLKFADSQPLSLQDIVNVVTRVDRKLTRSGEKSIEKNPGLRNVQNYLDWFLEVY